MSDAPAVGIVVVTHGASGADMLDTVRRLLGAAQVNGVTAIDVPTTASRDEAMASIRRAVETVDSGAGVVVACDLHGATATNCAVDLMQARHVVVVCGVNLAMLVKLTSAPRRGTTAEAVAQGAVDTAVRSIRVERGRE